MNAPLPEFWDRAFQERGTTGYGDPLLLRYDQPVRLKTVRKAIRRLFPAGLEGKDVLDIGCGTGDFMELSAGLGAASVDGIDLSAQVLAQASARFSGNGRVKLHCGTVLEKVTDRERYDLITSVTVLQHHVEDDELMAALAALRASMKPDGRMIVLELAPPHEETDRQYNGGTLYLVERSPRAWRAAFDAAGLRLIGNPVMPQLGIFCLRMLDRAVGAIFRLGEAAADAPPSAPTDPVVPAPAPALSLPRRLRRKALEWVRRAVLFLCRPFDHWLGLPLPPARFRTYRVFVLSKG